MSSPGSRRLMLKVLVYVYFSVILLNREKSNPISSDLLQVNKQYTKSSVRNSMTMVNITNVNICCSIQSYL